MCSGPPFAATFLSMVKGEGKGRDGPFTGVHGFLKNGGWKGTR